MKYPEDRRCYIVKHNLEALQALPNFIWNSAAPKNHPPCWFRRIKKGDRWIGFAYTTTDEREERVSLITGLYECVRTARYGKLTPRAQAEARHPGGAWLIEGKPIGPRVDQPIVVPPIDVLLRRKTFSRTTFVPIDAGEFKRIKKYVKSHCFDPDTIPLLGREPRCEQEVLSIIAFAHKKLGIEQNPSIPHAISRPAGQAPGQKGNRFIWSWKCTASHSSTMITTCRLAGAGCLRTGATRPLAESQSESSAGFTMTGFAQDPEEDSGPRLCAARFRTAVPDTRNKKIRW